MTMEEYGRDEALVTELSGLLGNKRAESVLCLQSVGSTNEYLKVLARSGAPGGTAVIAQAQTAGKGRLGRSFHSPKGEGLYLSMLLRPHCAPADAAQLTAWTAVAVRRALERVCGLSVGIKWVNDIVLNGRKLGGILTETSVEAENGSIRYIIAGVGLNLLQSSFPPELSGTATSLLLETGRAFSRGALAAALIEELDSMAGEFPGAVSGYLREYREACLTLGRGIRFYRDGIQYTGSAEDIDGNFGLLVRLPDGDRETLRFGEVSARGLYGYL